jgi:acetyl esterase/lipase
MKTLTLAAAALFCTLVLPAPLLVVAADAPPNAPAPIEVWPSKAPGETGQVGAEQWQQNKPGEKPFKKVTNVSQATLTVYRPAKEKDTGVAVIVCPGGGYKALMMDYEGEDAATWLNSLGVTGIVLKYRVGDREGTPRWLPALQDAQRAMSLVRSKAKEWGIKEDRIGMLGFSAGGHLTAATGTNFDKRAYEAIDAVDKVNCRPDFGVVVYPGGVVAKGKGELSPEIRVTAQTPPMFIVQANDDRVDSENSVFLYLALKRAGVPAELHIYAAGGHGFGMRQSDKPVATWTQRCAEWMRNQDLLPHADPH